MVPDEGASPQEARVEPQLLTVDITTSEGEDALLAASWFEPVPGSPPRPTLVCLPGGTYTRGYFDLEVPGHPGYSFARIAAEEGFGVLTLDQLGTGASSRPDAEVGLTDQADAVAATLDRLRHQGVLDPPLVAVGHSMGGYVAMRQQASHRSYDTLAILGTTNREVAPLSLPPEAVALAATPDGRAALVARALAAMPDRYVDGERSPMRRWFHLDDVPSEVIEADDAATLTCVPRLAGAESTVPGITVDDAAAIEVPVLLAYGEVDVSPDPHAEPTCFARCPDLTLVVLPGSGHCHHMAGTRRQLWDRILGWTESVVGPGGG